MAERVPAPADATTEAIATTALFLNVTAVIALAVCLARFGMSDMTVAMIAGVVAVLSFAASIVCFSASARDRQGQELSTAQVVADTTRTHAAVLASGPLNAFATRADSRCP